MFFHGAMYVHYFLICLHDNIHYFFTVICVCDMQFIHNILHPYSWSILICMWTTPLIICSYPHINVYYAPVCFIIIWICNLPLCVYLLYYAYLLRPQYISLLQHNDTYGELFTLALQTHEILCLGLYRLMDPRSNDPRDRKRVVLCNPDYDLELFTSDRVSYQDYDLDLYGSDETSYPDYDLELCTPVTFYME